MKLIIKLLCAMLVVFASGCKESNDTEGANAENAKQPAAKVEDVVKTKVVKNINEIQDKVELKPAGESVFKAALRGDIDTIKAALADNVDCNSKDPERETTLLMLASFDGHTELMELLIKKGCDLNVQDVEGRTALMYCASGDNVDAVKVLLDAGASVNVTDKAEHFTALMYAAAEGRLDVVKLLLDYNADCTKKDIDGDTARTFASNNGHYDVVEAIDEFLANKSESE